MPPHKWDPVGTPTDVPEQRVLEQSMRLPDGGAVTGWAATSRYRIPCTRIERAAFDAMRLADDEREAAVVPAMVAAAKKSSLVRMRRYVDDHPRFRDVRKEDAFRRVGIEVVHVTGTDLLDRTLVVDRILAGRQRALFEPHGDRRWIAKQPYCQ